MAEHCATIRWKCDTTEFLKGKYSRAHTWTFDGGLTVPASSAPSAVPLPWSVAENVDPEEAYVASIASCHMLTFLWLAFRARFEVVSYEDEAVGIMTKNEAGRQWVSRVTLHPKIVYGGDRRPTAEEEARLHHDAHAECFIANSVKTEIVVA